MSIHLRFFILLVSITALVFSGCTEEQTLQPDRDQALVPSSPPGETEYIAILPEDKELADLEGQGFTIIQYVEEIRLLRFTTTKKMNKLQGLFDAVETNDPVVISDPINLIDGFAEFDWVEETYPSQRALECLNLDEVHQYATGAGVRVGVIDTGIDLIHPHLAGRVDLIDDPVLGSPWEFMEINDPYDAFGHGSHVAGTILTVAPDAIVVPFRALFDHGTGTDFEVHVALHASITADVDIVNLSIRLSDESVVVQDALQAVVDAGILVVAAAGNETENRDPVFPASDFRTIAVAATAPGLGESCEDIASFSAMGDQVDFAVIGMGVRSSVPGGTVSDPWVKSATGTSVASAVATGNIALLLGDIQGIPTPTDPMEELRTSALAVTGGTVLEGRISAYHALGLDEN